MNGVRAVPAGRVSNSPDPDHGCCCTARAWTLFFVILKIVGMANLFLLALPGSLRTVRRRIPPELLYYLEDMDFYVRLMYWAALPLLLVYCLALIGVIKEKTGLISFYIGWLFLELVMGLGLEVCRFTRGNPIGDFLFSVVFTVLLSTWEIHCAEGFRKRVVFRQSHLQSEPSTFYSA